jgi:hypothetical protein
VFELITTPIRMAETFVRVARDTAAATASDLASKATETAQAVDVRGQLQVINNIVQSGILDPGGPLDRMVGKGGLLLRLAEEDGVLERIIERDGPLDRLLEREGLLAKVTEREMLERLIALSETLDKLGPALDRIGPALDALNSRIATLQDLMHPGGAVGDLVARIPRRRRKSDGTPAEDTTS